MERTLSIIKPDGVAQGLIGEVIQRLENAGLKIVAIKMIHLTKKTAEGFYAVHRGKPFYDSLTDFSSTCVVMIRKETGHAKYRTDGPLIPSRQGMILQKFASSIECNNVHGSDARYAFDGLFFNALRSG
jgi:nucleoside-diphosphate kinase